MESARSYAEKKQCSRVEFRLKGSELSMVRGRMKKKKKNNGDLDYDKIVLGMSQPRCLGIP